MAINARENNGSASPTDPFPSYAEEAENRLMRRSCCLIRLEYPTDDRCGARCRRTRRAIEEAQRVCFRLDHAAIRDGTNCRLLCAPCDRCTRAATVAKSRPVSCRDATRTAEDSSNVTASCFSRFPIWRKTPRDWYGLNRSSGSSPRIRVCTAYPAWVFYPSSPREPFSNLRISYFICKNRNQFRFPEIGSIRVKAISPVVPAKEPARLLHRPRLKGARS